MKKILIISTLCLSLCRADPATSQETKSKSNSKNTNSFPQSQKQEYVLQQLQQTQPQYYPVQFYQKPVFVPQQPAMVFIAHPGLVPQHMLYNSATQQLLNYFHNNPQARYQFLHGYQPHQAAQQYISHNHIASPSIGNYQIVPAPHYQHQYVAAPSQLNYAQQPSSSQISGHYNHPVHLSEIANLAQLTAQNIISSPYRSTPAIVTGFENFTPEQQAQIKAQLGAHLGTPISTPPTQGQAQNQQNGSGQYTRFASNNQNEFVPSSAVKNEGSTTTISSNYPTDIYRSQFAKG